MKQLNLPNRNMRLRNRKNNNDIKVTHLVGDYNGFIK